MDALETKLVGVTIPQKQYDEILTRLKPLETVQDFIRTLIEKELLEGVTS
jgi:hypothetical protein